MPVKQIAVVGTSDRPMDSPARQQALLASSQTEEQANSDITKHVRSKDHEIVEGAKSEEHSCDSSSAKDVTHSEADNANALIDRDKYVEAETVIIGDCGSDSSDDRGLQLAAETQETQVGVHVGKQGTDGNVANNGKKTKLSGKSSKKDKPSPIKKKDSGTQETLHANSPTPLSADRCDSSMSNTDVCRICQCDTCEIQKESPLVSPCLCSGSLKYIHQACLQKWIKSSDKMSCELCQFEYQMTKKTKPFREWEKLDMTPAERRKVVCSVTFHVIAITCVVWSLYVLIDRTTEEVEAGSLLWPFWTKLIVVAIGFTGGVVFMYVQCKMYLNLCKKWRTYNKVILVSSISEATREVANHENLLKLSEKQAELEEERRGTNFDVFTIVQET